METADGITFDEPEVAASFTVDEPRRLISGLLVPWGAVAKSGNRKWRFSRGSLHWSQRGHLNQTTWRCEDIARCERIAGRRLVEIGRLAGQLIKPAGGAPLRRW